MNELQNAQTKLDEFTDRINSQFKGVKYVDPNTSDGGTVGVIGFGLAEQGEKRVKPKSEYYILPMIVAGGIRTREMETVDEYILDFENLVGVLGDTKDLFLVYRRRPKICHNVDFDMTEGECICNSRIIVYRKIED